MPPDHAVFVTDDRRIDPRPSKSTRRTLITAVGCSRDGRTTRGQQPTVTRYCWLPVGATKGARLLRGSAICSSTPLMCREIPVSAVRGVLAVPTLPKVAFPRTRQEPPVNLGFSQGHKERGRACKALPFPFAHITWGWPRCVSASASASRRKLPGVTDYELCVLTAVDTFANGRTLRLRGSSSAAIRSPKNIQTFQSNPEAPWFRSPDERHPVIEVAKHPARDVRPAPSRLNPSAPRSTLTSTRGL